MIYKVTILLFMFSFACQKRFIEQAPPSENLDFTTAEKIISDNLDKYKSNVVLMVSKNGKIVLNKKWGSFDENTEQPIASATKWLSGAVIMTLIDDGKLSLDDTIGKFLPIFTKNKKGNITIRQCFSHTTGFPAETPEGYENNRNISLEECVNLTAQNTKMVAKAGQSFLYGNVGMQIGGRIVEVITGKNWQLIFNEKIGNPCDMSVIYSPLSKNNPRIAGGAVTSARDYLNFLEMMANNGIYKNKRVLSENAIKILLKDQTAAATIVYTPYPNNSFSKTPTNPVRYGVGIWLDVVDKQGNVLEVSSPGLFGTHPWLDSKNQVSGIIFTFSDYTDVHETNLKTREAIRIALE